MSKESRLKTAVSCKSMRLEVLTSDDPEVWLERDGLEEWLGRTMDEIQDYINASEMMDADPLVFLREYLPEFTWELHEDLTQEELVSVLHSADYVWYFGVFPLKIERVITAKQVGRDNPRSLFFCPDTERHDKSTFRSKIKSVLPTIRFVLNGNDEYMSTFIE